LLALFKKHVFWGLRGGVIGVMIYVYNEQYVVLTVIYFYVWYMYK